MFFQNGLKMNYNQFLLIFLIFFYWYVYVHSDCISPGKLAHVPNTCQCFSTSPSPPLLPSLGPLPFLQTTDLLIKVPSLGLKTCSLFHLTTVLMVTVCFIFVILFFNFSNSSFFSKVSSFVTSQTFLNSSIYNDKQNNPIKNKI